MTSRLDTPAVTSMCTYDRVHPSLVFLVRPSLAVTADGDDVLSPKEDEA